MDPPLPSILKKRRLQRIGGRPIIECRREFTLPHKFPSMINTPKCNSVFEKFTTSNTSVQSSLNGLKSKKVLATNGITKLRIKTKDGIDLGEVKVQLLTNDQKNLLNVPQIVKVQQASNCMKNSVAGLSTSSQSNTVKIVKPLGSQLCRETQKCIRELHCPIKQQFVVSHSKIPVARNKNKNVIQKHEVLSKVNKMNQSNSPLNDNGYRLLHNVPAVSKKITEPEKTLVLINEQEVRDEHIFKNNEKCIENKNNDTLEKTNVTDVKSSLIELAESKFPIVRCERLQIPPTKVNINKIKRQEKENNTLSHENIRKRKRILLKNNEWNHSAKRIENASNNNSLNLESSENQKHASILKEPTRCDNNVNDFDNDDVVIVCEKNEIAGQHYNNVQEKKCTIISMNNKDVDNETQSVNTKPNFDRNEIICKNNVLNENPEFDISHDGKKDNEKKEKLSEYLNVIKEALTSVKDEQLRIKALHALAECGVGIAKQVPIIPSERLRTVHDSQIQTDVFGLLDRQSFVLVKKTMSTIKRIKQIERSTVNLCPVMKEVQTQTEMQIQTESKLHNNVYNTDLFSILEGPHMVVPQDTLDIDNYFNEIFNNNSDINKVQKILSTPHSLCKKVAAQLKKDYDELQYCDNNGMLNIHRAVVNNQLCEVQKLLLILRASKTSIDVLTEDGMTSLELGIQYNASESIVKLLLEAGAKPISSELICDSAVLLASKQSSPLLPLLLNYVTEPQLLNREDSSGLAPLHYCALNGFLDGVIALVEVGADINLKDHRSGRTPFFHALENNYTLVAQKLLECGAIANLPNFSGQSVLSLIDETNNFSFKALLKQIVI
ncbi:hypothetical protein E2986_04005 [Frieseomelitta varia]|uniref:Uncharacterized protein n=1 Tax=Frieseomelitta varia TaxID=561572 RepID=A0A833RJ82_9HYME|nr:hypothetical protein E2986_04005 [Frieseomelitta varia]